MGTDLDQQAGPPTPAVRPSIGAAALTSGRRAPRRTTVQAAAPYAVAALVTFAVALWTYRPWTVDGVVAFPYGDSLSFHAWVQATVESGWYESAERLAAPFVQNGHTYVVTDELLFALIGKVLAPLTGSAPDAVLWWLILSFPAAALAGVGVARYLGVRRVPALIPGVLFPLLPDHFLRGSGHYSLSSAWAIPLGLWLAVSLLRRPTVTGARRVAFEAAMLVAAVAIALTNAYYAVFAILLVAAAGVAGAIAARSVRVLLTGVARGLALLLPVVIAIRLDTRYAPDVIGYSSFAITRSPADAEVYGGKIIAMLLPSPEHRFAFARGLRQAYDATFANPAETPALGLVAAAGFVALVVYCVLQLLGGRTGVARPRLQMLAGLTWLLLLGYSVGGLGSIWAFALEGGGIRVWSRLHTYIALVALIAVAVVVSRLGRRPVRAAAVAVVLVVGLVDQTSPLSRPDVAQARSVRDEMTALTARIAQDEGASAAVYQFPQVSFPLQNRQVEPASPYDHLLPYLYSDDLRWSFGGYQGEPSADWPESLARRPVGEQAALVAAAGFAGILVDTLALTSDPALRRAVEQEWGEPDLTSTSGRWQYVDLRSDAAPCPAPETEMLADVAVRPPILYASDAFALAPARRWSNDEGTARLTVLTRRAEGWPDVEVRFSVSTPTTALRLTFPDGTVRDVPAGADTAVQWAGTVPGTGAVITVDRVDGAGGYTVGDLSAEPRVPQLSRCLAAWEREALAGD